MVRGQVKEIKSLRATKEEAKLSLFTNDMIVYTENLQRIYKLLKLIVKFNKVAGYYIKQSNCIFFLAKANNWKPKLSKNSIYTNSKKDKIFRTKL